MKEGSDGDARVSPTPMMVTGVASYLNTGAAPVPPLSLDGQALVAGATLGGGGVVAANAESPTSDNGGGKMSRASSRGEAAIRDKNFECSMCQRSFGYKHVLQNHERTHTGEKPFECKECLKRFTRDHHLKTHMRLHTGEKPYHCTHCDRQFVQVANLRRHLRVHTGERPYACELCTSRFSDSNQLKAHMLIHKGEKPFECALCLGRFRRRHHLMHHKCPKEQLNQGKPRRGRRPKTAADLERDSHTLQLIPPDHPHLLHHHHHLHLDGGDSSTHQLPTTVPDTQERPFKRERKPRETRRIIKVSIPPPPIMGQASIETGRHHHYTLATSSYSGHSIPLPPPPPEQTEPEDLSMHANHSASGRNGQPHPTSRGHGLADSAAALHLRQSPSTRLFRHQRQPPHILMAGDVDEGDESEAMVEEEEEDEDSSEEELSPGIQWRRRRGYVQLRHHGQGGQEQQELELDETDEDEEDQRLRHDLQAANVNSDGGRDGDSDLDLPSEQGHHHDLPLHHGHHLLHGSASETSNASRGRILPRRHHPHQPHHHFLHDPIHLAPHHQLHMAHHYHEASPFMDVRGAVRRVAAAGTSASRATTGHADLVLPHQ